MKERFVTVNDFVYWIEIELFIYDKPKYKLASGYYLGSYAMGSYSKCICINDITSCVVRHVDPQYVFTDEVEARKMLDNMNGGLI